MAARLSPPTCLPPFLFQVLFWFFFLLLPSPFLFLSLFLSLFFFLFPCPCFSRPSSLFLPQFQPRQRGDGEMCQIHSKSSRSNAPSKGFGRERRRHIGDGETSWPPCLGGARAFFSSDSDRIRINLEFKWAHLLKFCLDKHDAP